MGCRQYCVVSGALFSLVAFAHLLRIIYGLPIRIGDYEVSMLLSWLGLVVPGMLAFWAFRVAGS